MRSPPREAFASSRAAGVRLRNGLLVSVFGLAALGCSDLFGPSLPDDRMALSPLPAEYEHWWSVVEMCSGLQAELDRVAWWFVPEQEVLPDGDATGTYYASGHQILLAEGVIREGFVVRHEMLHAVLASNHVYGHPKEYFENRCGGIVSCGGDCRDDVGEAPPTTSYSYFVRAEQLEVSVQVLPRVFSRSAPDGGCVTIVVGAEYVGADVAAMDLSGRVFGWTVEGWGGGGGGGPIPPNDTVLMPPGAVRYYAYDCPRRFLSFEPGEYVVGGTWQGVPSDGVTLTILP